MVLKLIYSLIIGDTTMKKYIVREEKEYGCTIYSVINSENGTRVNYFNDRESAETFANKQNK